MRQEDKELLIKDLSARILYDVKADGYPWIKSEYVNGLTKYEVNLQGTWVPLESCKLYLRPMSSMTDEECKEFFIQREKIVTIGSHQIILDLDSSDWLNKHHFDYRNLIEKGLALPAPPDMYKID